MLVFNQTCLVLFCKQCQFLVIREITTQVAIEVSLLTQSGISNNLRYGRFPLEFFLHWYAHTKTARHYHYPFLWKVLIRQEHRVIISMT
jgi:hypothetical protein